MFYYDFNTIKIKWKNISILFKKLNEFIYENDIIYIYSKIKNKKTNVNFMLF